MDVTAKVNYTVGVPPLVPGTVPFIGDETPDGYQPVEVLLRDARQKKPSLEANGFALAKHHLDLPAAAFFQDPAESGAGATTFKYFSEMKELLQKETGADLVLIQSQQVRDRGQAGKFGLANPFADSENNISGYANVVHTDFSAKKAEEKLMQVATNRTLLELFTKGGKGCDEAKRLGCRYMLVNAWRNVNPDHPIANDALACCDAASVNLQTDAVRCEVPLVSGEFDVGNYAIKLRAKSAEQYRLVPDNATRHQWYYFPAMTSDEVLIIKQFDSSPEASARFCFHTSFKSPSADANAPQRQSVEVRAIAFFFDQPRAHPCLPSAVSPQALPGCSAKFVTECSGGLPWPEFPAEPTAPAPGSCGCKHAANPYHTCVAACGCECPPPAEVVEIPAHVVKLYRLEDEYVQQQAFIFHDNDEWGTLLAEDVVLRHGEREIRGRAAAVTAALGLHYGPLNRVTSVSRFIQCGGPDDANDCIKVQGEIVCDYKLGREQRFVVPFTAHLVFNPEGLLAERHTFADTSGVAAFAATGLGWPLARSRLHGAAGVGRFGVEDVSSAYDQAVLDASQQRACEPGKSNFEELADIFAL